MPKQEAKSTVTDAYSKPQLHLVDTAPTSIISVIIVHMSFRSRTPNHSPDILWIEEVVLSIPKIYHQKKEKSQTSTIYGKVGRLSTTRPRRAEKEHVRWST